MKYIDAEKLKRFVGELKERAKRNRCDSWGIVPDALEEVEGFIDSLQQEQPKPSGYDKALLEVKSLVDKLYDEASIGLNEYDSGLYNGIAETCMKLRGFIKARLDSDEQPEMDLGKFTEKIKTFQGRYKHPEIVSIKGAMAFMARMFYQYPNVARRWYDSLPKAKMD